MKKLIKLTLPLLFATIGSSAGFADQGSSLVNFINDLRNCNQLTNPSSFTSPENVTLAIAADPTGFCTVTVTVIPPSIPASATSPGYVPPPMITVCKLSQEETASMTGEEASTYAQQYDTKSADDKQNADPELLQKLFKPVYDCIKTNPNSGPQPTNPPPVTAPPVGTVLPGGTLKPGQPITNPLPNVNP